MSKKTGVPVAIGSGMVLVLWTAVLLLWTQRPGYAAGGVLCVVPPGEPPGPFAGCAQVFTSVQTAVDTAVPHSEIWVATGVYTDVHERNEVWQVAYVDKSVTIRGGYTTPFSDPPDPTQHVTTLDAGEWGRVLFITGSISVTIEGLYLTGGASYPSGWVERESGGGVYAAGATILLQDNIITGNRFGGSNPGYGGGVYLTAVDATLRRNQIQNNIGYGPNHGGGLAARQSDLVLQNNVFFSNTAGMHMEPGITTASGGGVYIFESQVIMENNDVTHNTALHIEGLNPLNAYGYGGGLMLVYSSGQVRNNQISHNVAAYSGNGFGGGLYIEGLDDLMVAHNQIENNSASLAGYGHGGGLAVLPRREEPLPDLVTLHENRIVSNTAVVSGSLGMGGGVAILFGPHVGFPRPAITLTYNAILSNTAVFTGGVGLGGGLVAGVAHLHLDQNEIARNVAAASGPEGHGGGLYLAANQSVLTGNIIRHNQASGGGGGMVLEEDETMMLNTAVIDNQGDGLHLICDSHLQAVHLTIARNTGYGLHLAQPEWCQEYPPVPWPSTAVFTNTILAGHTVGAFVAADSSLSLHGVLWHDTPTPFQAEPNAQVTISHQHFGDPHFAADGYHIMAQSAARFRGLPAGVRIDVDGQPRPLTNAALGADEYWVATHYLPLVQNSPMGD